MQDKMCWLLEQVHPSIHMWQLLSLFQLEVWSSIYQAGHLNKLRHLSKDPTQKNLLI
jgi:hypothetical protein